MKLYLDIETTGLSATNNSLTVLGVLKGNDFVQLVEGINLSDEAVHGLFADVTEIVSFNGRRFDVPFLLARYKTLTVPARHKDLMYLGWEVGLKGGLKKLEVQLGLSREGDVKNGYEAVLLWQKYLRENCQVSLRRLLQYNKEDVVNLPALEHKLESMWAKQAAKRPGKTCERVLGKSGSPTAFPQE